MEFILKLKRKYLQQLKSSNGRLMRKNKIKFKKLSAAASVFAIVVATSGNVLGGAWEDSWTTTSGSGGATIEKDQNGTNAEKVTGYNIFGQPYTTEARFTNESNFYFSRGITGGLVRTYPDELTIQGNTQVGTIDLYGQGKKNHY